MQFKHPEFLYALLLLIIPIIIHLFQLQRFTKVPFTNVKFLKKIVQQTRKSSQLKKWLILATRMLAFSCIILAFSQPYFSEQQKLQKTKTILYLDNSLSMTYKNQGQEILNKSYQEIIENFSANSEITLLTNDQVFRDLDQKELKNTLLNLQTSTEKQSFEMIFFRINQEIKANTNTLSHAILISDFQHFKNINKANVTNVNTSILLINTAPSTFENIFIDSLYIAKKEFDKITLKAQISNTNSSKENYSVSLYNDAVLIGKTTTPLSKNSLSEVEFIIPNQENFNGKISVIDEKLSFDNSLFFHLSKPKKIKVFSVGKTTSFLAKIFTKNEFDFQQKSRINLNEIKNQHLIILNEIEKIDNTLTSALKDFQKSGGSIIVIPSPTIDLITYKNLFRELRMGSITTLQQQELSITNINYDHPILSGVFEKSVTNFQYPKVQSYYKTELTNNAAILQFQNKEAFVSQLNTKNGRVFWFSAALTLENSNFQHSPLIVPVFYNIGLQSHQLPKWYYTIGESNNINVDISLRSDEILKIENQQEEFIPLQKVYKNSVKITTINEPKKPGFYKLTNSGTTIETLAYNYSRDLSVLNYTDVSELFKDSKKVTVSHSIKQAMSELNDLNQIKSVFRWFLALAVLFLLIEIVVLKFFKI